MNIGKFKLFFDRWKSYISTVQFVMIVVMFGWQSGMSWWLLGAGFVVSVAFMWLDARYILPQEYEAGQLKNSEWTRRMDRIEEMLKQLGAK